jgi:uncharacterized membrane protein YpjA
MNPKYIRAARAYAVVTLISLGFWAAIVTLIMHSH